MLASRGWILAKTTGNIIGKRPNVATNLRLLRKGHGAPWTYRKPPPLNKYSLIAAEMSGGFLWWWMMYHTYHDPGHIFGEYDIPDPQLWTDEELGIPPDDEDC